MDDKSLNIFDDTDEFSDDTASYTEVVGPATKNGGRRQSKKVITVRKSTNNKFNLKEFLLSTPIMITIRLKMIDVIVLSVVIGGLVLLLRIFR